MPEQWVRDDCKLQDDKQAISAITTPEPIEPEPEQNEENDNE